MPPIVVDASSIVELLLQTSRANSVQQAVSGLNMMAPDFLNVEVLSTLRRRERLGKVTPKRAMQAVTDLQAAPITGWPTLPLIDTIWGLRSNLSAYDACYVALARALACQLVTGDARLARAPGVLSTVIVV